MTLTYLQHTQLNGFDMRGRFSLSDVTALRRRWRWPGRLMTVNAFTGPLPSGVGAESFPAVAGIMSGASTASSPASEILRGPVALTVPFNGPISSLSMGTSNAVVNELNCALISEGKLYTWGNLNYLGRTANATDRGRPVQAGSDTDWAKVSCGVSHMLLLKTDGSLWSVGANSAGQCGTGGTTTQNAFYHIGTDTWLDIATCYETSAAVKSDGTLWTWGAAALGRLGNNTTTPNVLSPAQIGVLTTWSELHGGPGHFVGLHTDGAIYSWGYGNDGRPGTGTTANVLVPTRIGTSTDNTKIMANPDYLNGTTVVLKTNGNLWGAGYGSSHQLNGNSTTSSLAIISGATWDDFCPTTAGILATQGNDLYHCGGLSEIPVVGSGSRVFTKLLTFPSPPKMAAGSGLWAVWT